MALEICIIIKINYLLFYLSPFSLIVMDYDEFSADDFIGGTRVKLYEVLYTQSHKINIRRLLDDNIVSPLPYVCSSVSNSCSVSWN